MELAPARPDELVRLIRAEWEEQEAGLVYVSIVGIDNRDGRPAC